MSIRRGRVTTSAKSPLPDGKQSDSLNQIAGVIALILSVVGPFLVSLAYLLQNDAGFYLGFHGAMYGPIFSGIATLLGILALPDKFARIALCICGIWWAWWIYAVTQWSWTI